MGKRKDPLKAALSNLGQEGAQGGGLFTSSLIDRRNALTDISDGSRKDVVHRLVDPGLVRPWQHHNRRYEDLTPARVSDLIEGLRAQGRQEFPAIVRRLPASSPEGHEYEFICGARRHFAVSYLRANGYPDFRYLIEVRNLSDEEAFRLSDVENRDREDLCDYERACDYLSALELYYGGQQKRMAERLEMSASYLSNFLDLGRLPPRIVAAFGSPQELRVHHSRSLKPLLRGRSLEEVQGRADGLARLQGERRAAGQPLLQATAVLAELKGGTRPAARVRDRRFEVPLGGKGKGAVSVTEKSGRVNTSFALDGTLERDAFLEAMGKVWDQLGEQ